MTRRFTALATLAVALLLTACGAADQPDSPAQAGQGQGADGALLSVPQAQQGAEQWWNDHEQALLKRDLAALARLVALPQAGPELELVRAALATHQGVIAQPRQPSAVRVHVPAAQRWPVPVLAVYDVPGSGGARATHVAVLLMKLNPGSALVATANATLDAAEPSLDTDAAGYVRMGAPASQLGTAFATYMEDVVHATPAPSPAPFAPGKLTSEAGGADAAFLHDPGGHSHGSLSTVDIEYSPVPTASPVFELAGGAGGFTLVAATRQETLHPLQGQVLNQDAQRRNYGIDLAPGQYQQIAIASLEVLAVTVPPAGTPATVVGSGGGVTSEG